jgi:hypothetical protein
MVWLSRATSMKVHIKSYIPKDVSSLPPSHTSDSIQWYTYEPTSVWLYTNFPLTSLMSVSGSLPTVPDLGRLSSQLRRQCRLSFWPHLKFVGQQTFYPSYMHKIRPGSAHLKFCFSTQSIAKKAIPGYLKGSLFLRVKSTGHLCRIGLDPQRPSILPRVLGPCRWTLGAKSVVRSEVCESRLD